MRLVGLQHSLITSSILSHTCPGHTATWVQGGRGRDMTFFSIAHWARSHDTITSDKCLWRPKAYQKACVSGPFNSLLGNLLSVSPAQQPITYEARFPRSKYIPYLCLVEAAWSPRMLPLLALLLPDRGAFLLSPVGSRVCHRHDAHWTPLARD